MCDSKDSFNQFARALHGVVSQNNKAEGRVAPKNVIFSPISIHTSLMLAFVGAAGATSDELREGLRLGPVDRHQVARTYHEFWTKFCSFGPKVTLRTVNRLFVNQYLTLKTDFDEVAKEFFLLQAQPLDFGEPAEATRKINAVVEEATEGKITDLMRPDAVNLETSAILVNALYFKGLFQKPFTPECTMPADFLVDRNASVQVDMMYQEDKFLYADLPELNARAVKLPYADSDISLLILLPKKVCGVLKLEEQLKDFELSALDQRMTMEDVEIFLPKFCIGFDLDVKKSLQELGISQLFEKTADLSLLFEGATGQKISEVMHRGYIHVNEAGSEAAAATYLKVVPMSLNMDKKTFVVDHPFVFYVRSSRAVFFTGRFMAPPISQLSRRSID